MGGEVAGEGGSVLATGRSSGGVRATRWRDSTGWTPEMSRR